MWLVWPHNTATWPGRFVQAREQFARFVESVARYEIVELLAVGDAGEHAAHRLANVDRCNFHGIPTNDSWIRDYGPVFLNGRGESSPIVLNWKYNAWGEKYRPFEQDNAVPGLIAQRTHRNCVDGPMVLEGGAIEGNGAGIVLTTDRCLPNKNRNPSLSKETIELILCEYLGADSVIWLTGEIPGDDTDGHIDQIARFTDTSTVLLVDPPNSDVYLENRSRLRRWSNESGIQLEIVPVANPEPRRVNGAFVPASYANFVLVNGAVLVPEFKDRADTVAADRIAECFPERTLETVPADELVLGLGALHCLSQQEPEYRAEEP